jgi:hypothetical protein
VVCRCWSFFLPRLGLDFTVDEFRWDFHEHSRGSVVISLSVYLADLVVATSSYAI